jgi:hypothetical protein
LVALEVLLRERKPGRKAKWLFRKAVQLGQRIAAEDNMRFRELLDRVKELWTEYDPKPDASDRTIMDIDSG